MNVLEELFYGNINPNEKCFDRRSEYAKFNAIVSDNEKKLLAFLKCLPRAQEEQHLFSQLMNAQAEILSFSQLDRFIEGFQFGAGFMLDTFILPQKSVVRDIN